MMFAHFVANQSAAKVVQSFSATFQRGTNKNISRRDFLFFLQNSSETKGLFTTRVPHDEIT
jgi:hypothetical protein